MLHSNMINSYYIIYTTVLLTFSHVTSFFSSLHILNVKLTKVSKLIIIQASNYIDFHFILHLMFCF